MASKSDITVVTADSMRSMAASLKQIAGTYEQMAQLLDEAEIKELVDVRSLATGVQGVLDVGTFCGYVLASFLQRVGENGMRGIKDAETEFRIRQKHTKTHRDAVKAALAAKKDQSNRKKPVKRGKDNCGMGTTGDKSPICSISDPGRGTAGCSWFSAFVRFARVNKNRSRRTSRVSHSAAQINRRQRGNRCSSRPCRRRRCVMRPAFQ